MACPVCGCKETYQYDEGDFASEEGIYRCAACRAIFPIEDELPEEDS